MYTENLLEKYTAHMNISCFAFSEMSVFLLKTLGGKNFLKGNVSEVKNVLEIRIFFLRLNFC